MIYPSCISDMILNELAVCILNLSIGDTLGIRILVLSRALQG